MPMINTSTIPSRYRLGLFVFALVLSLVGLTRAQSTSPFFQSIPSYSKSGPASSITVRPAAHSTKVPSKLGGSEGLHYFAASYPTHTLNILTDQTFVSNGETYERFGYAERFSSSLDHPTLDSITVPLYVNRFVTGSAFAVSVMHQKWITAHRGTETAQLPLPNFDDSAFVTSTYDGTSLVGVGFVIFTVHYNSVPIDTGFAVFVDKGTQQNSLGLQFDSVVGPYRDILVNYDRSYTVAFGSMGHSYSNFLWATINLTGNDSLWYYPNLAMTAYLTDAKSGVHEVVGTRPEMLKQNYPDPVTNSTAIDYTTSTASDVTLKVYNAVGMEVAMLVNEHQNAGNHSATFSAFSLPTGVYNYVLTAGQTREVRKMLIQR